MISGGVISLGVRVAFTFVVSRFLTLISIVYVLYPSFITVIRCLPGSTSSIYASPFLSVTPRFSESTVTVAPATVDSTRMEAALTTDELQTANARTMKKHFIVYIPSSKITISSWKFY